MKVLLVSDFYPPVIGGMEKHVHNLARGLRAEGHAVSVLTLDAVPRVEDHEGISVRRCPPFGARAKLLYRDAGRPYHPPAPVPALVRAIREHIAREAPDVVHAHGWSILSAARALRSEKVPLIATLHDYGLICPKKTLLRGPRELCTTPLKGCETCSMSTYGIKGPFVTGSLRYHRRLLARVDRYLAVSNFVAKAHGPLLLGAPIEVVPNFYSGVEGKHPPQRRDELPREPYYLYLGALTPEKGYQWLADAWSQAPVPGHKLVLMGRSAADQRTPAHPDVIVLRNADQNLVESAIAFSAAVVTPSLWPDPCPTVAFEAMAYGRPLIATRTGGFPDLVEDERSGLLIATGDTDALRAGLLRVASDAESAARMGQHARENVLPRFRAAHVIPEIIAQYQAVAR